jgi:hypothetical protein
MFGMSQLQFVMRCFCDTLENFGDTQMCRDTQFGKHCTRLSSLGAGVSRPVMSGRREQVD